MKVDPQQFDKAIFLGRGVERFTQDSPVLPDVWAEYGQRPNERIDLLLNPYTDESPGRLCDILLTRLEHREEKPNRYCSALPTVNWESKEASVSQSMVAIRLYFDELVCVVLPMTRWWNTYMWKDKVKDKELKDEEQEIRVFLDDKNGEQARMVEFMKQYPLERTGSAAAPDITQAPESPVFTSQLLWLVRVVGAVALAGKGGPGAQRADNDTFHIDGNEKEVVEAAVALLSDLKTVSADDLIKAGREPTRPRPRPGKGMDADARSFIWSVNLNRRAKTAMNISTTTIKADAARLLFEISCKHLTWAILDSGVDASHPALQRIPESDRRFAPSVTLRNAILRRYESCSLERYLRHLETSSRRNCLITTDLTLKVTDFGLAKVLAQESGPRRGGAPEYMSPEQWNNFEAVDQQSDIYSFGAMLYEMLIGLPPFGKRPMSAFVSSKDDTKSYYHRLYIQNIIYEE